MPSSPTTKIYTLSLPDALPICAITPARTSSLSIPRRWPRLPTIRGRMIWDTDRKSTRLNSSHLGISYAVFSHHKDLHSFPTRRSSDLCDNSCTNVITVHPETMAQIANHQGTDDLGYRSEEHTSELQSLRHLVCRLLPPQRSTLFPYPTLFRSVR